MLDEQRAGPRAEPAVPETESPVAAAPPDLVSRQVTPDPAPPPGAPPDPAAPPGAPPDPAAPPGAPPDPAAPPGAVPQLAGAGSARLRPSAYTDPVVWAAAVAVFCAYAAISLLRLLQLNPSSWDLGIYTEYVKQYADLRAPIVDIRAPGFNLLGDHFQPLVAVLAPFFRVFPSSATLLVAQAVLVAVSVFPVSQVAREKLGLGPSRAIAVAYGFSWGLQQLAKFDFHEIALAIPLLAFSLSALARGRTRATVCWALPLVFVKEDQGFTVAAIGLYLVCAGLYASGPARGGSQTSQHSGGSQASQHSGGSQTSQASQARRHPNATDIDVRRVAAGQFLLVWGFAWSLLAIGVIIPHFNPAHHYDYWSDGGILAPGGHLSLAGLARQLFHAWPAKLETITMLLLPTIFIALRSPLILIAAPSLLLRFMSTDSSFWGTYWHYNATLMPVIFIAAVDALARMDAKSRIRRFGPALMVVPAIVLAFQFPLSSLWRPPTYQISPHVAAAEAAMARVPDGATVLTTLDLLAPLAARTDTFWFGNSGNPQTQYIVFDGLDSDYSPAIKNVPAFIASFYPPHTYTQIFSSGDVYVFLRTR
jgi:uncharacterized membrane protein